MFAVVVVVIVKGGDGGEKGKGGVWKSETEDEYHLCECIFICKFVCVCVFGNGERTAVM